MFPKIKVKEKGQGLLEYALILVLVAIVVIACLMLSGALSKAGSTSTTSSILNPAPTVGTTEANPLYVSLTSEDRGNYKEMEYGYGCYKKSFDSGYSIRVGTEYADVSRVRIKRLDDNYYSICVDVKGVKVQMIYDLVKNPQ